MKKVLVTLASALLLPFAMQAQLTLGSWDFTDSASTFSAWTTPTGATSWYYTNEVGNNAPGCLFGVDSEEITSPAIALPAGSSYNLSFYSAFSGDLVSYSNILVLVSTNGTTYDTVYTVEPTSSFTRNIVSLASYSGTVYVRFANRSFSYADFGFYTYAFIDDVEIMNTSLPVYEISGNYYSIVGQPNVFAAEYVTGDTTGTVTYAWTSVLGTIATNGNATASIDYTAAGVDTVTLTVNNGIGSSTSSYVTEVIECNTIAQFPYYNQFETIEDIFCWNVVNASTTTEATWAPVQAGTYAHSGNIMYYSFLADDEAADAYLISPAVEMPADAEGFNLEYWVAAYDTSTYCNYEVLISTTGTALSDFTRVLEDSVASTDYVRHLIDLSNYEGQTIYIAFHSLLDEAENMLFLDDVAIRSTLAPIYTVSVPATTEVGMTVNLGATYVEGSTTNVTYSWTSTMAAAGNATLSNATAQNATIVYTAAGTDTIVFTAQNDHGTYTDTAVVRIFVCDAISAFPWEEGFEGNTDCWSFISTNAEDNGMMPTVAQEYAHNGEGFLIGFYNDYFDLNQWAISPAIQLPEGSNYELSWYADMWPYETYTIHYEVMISTSTDTSTFVQLFEANSVTDGYAFNTVSLAEYAGQTVRIAFHHISEAGGYNLLIDDIRIGEPLPPTVEIYGYETVIKDEETQFYASSPNATSYSWTVDGTAQSETGDVLSYTFTTAGQHTVSVVATNAAGNSQPASMNVEVIECETITEFPWMADFESNETDYSCWRLFDYNGDNMSWFPYVGTGDNALGYNSFGALFDFSYNSDYEVGIQPQDLILTPTMAIPAEGSYTLSWYARGFDPNYAEEYYSVLIFTGDEDYDSVFSETTTGEWAQHIVDLSAYAGTSIRVGFFHYNCYDEYALAIDNIRVGQAGSEGIADIAGFDFSVYPNPASEMLNVEGDGISLIEMLDINGRVVLESHTAGSLDISSLSSGVYMVRVTTSNGVSSQKVVKK